MGYFSFSQLCDTFSASWRPPDLMLLCETNLGADDPSVALRVEKVVEARLVLVRRTPVVVDGVEVVHAHLVSLESDTFKIFFINI